MDSYIIIYVEKEEYYNSQNAKMKKFMSYICKLFKLKIMIVCIFLI